MTNTQNTSDYEAAKRAAAVIRGRLDAFEVAYPELRMSGPLLETGAFTVEPATVEPATVEPAAVEPATVEPATVEPATAGARVLPTITAYPVYSRWEVAPSVEHYATLEAARVSIEARGHDIADFELCAYTPRTQGEADEAGL